MQVEVRGSDIESGIRSLKNLLKRDGIHDEVRKREESPNRTDRRRVKERIARRRKVKSEGRKEWRQQHAQHRELS